MQGAWPHAGDARGIFLELFGFGTATQKAPSACDFFERFFKKWRKNAETKGSCRGYSHMQGTPGEYFQNCLYFAQPLKRDDAGGTATCRGRLGNIFEIVCILHSHAKGSPFCLWSFEIFFKKWQEMRKQKGWCRGHTHMQGTPGEYFGNCLNFAQPLKRQTPPFAGNFF